MKIKSALIYLILIVGHYSIKSQVFAIPQGWIDSTGKEILCEGCDSTLGSHNYIAAFSKGGTWNFTNIKTGETSSINASKVIPFEEERAFYKKDNKWFLINESFETITAIQAHYVYAFSEGLARFQLGNRFGYLSKDGNVSIPAKYYGAKDFSEGLAAVYRNKKWGFIDKSNKTIIGFDFDYADNFGDQRAIVGNYNDEILRFKLIDGTSKTIMSSEEDYYFPFSNGLGLLRKGKYLDGNLIFINVNGTTEFSLDYTDAYPFKGNLASVYNGEKWGAIDKTGSLTIHCKYDRPLNFINGLALTSINSKLCYINAKGNVVWQKNK